MILEQYYWGCLAHSSYLIGDAETGIAAVVDPPTLTGTLRTLPSWGSRSSTSS